MMLGFQGSKRNDKRSTCRRVWGTPGEEKIVQMPATNGYYWSTMKKDTAEFVKECHNAKYKPT